MNYTTRNQKSEIVSRDHSTPAKARDQHVQLTLKYSQCHTFK